ncbi:MAG: dUTP diphosphatase [Proteobacteria bacterium]|nr:dUTP diphosphatase [Pseudomonadota bacterium]
MSERPTNPIWIKVLTDDDSLIPAYQTQGSAACDLRSTDEVTLPPGSRVIIGTGIKLEIPRGFGAMVCSRSGMAAKNGIQVLNAPGIIDTDYRGEVKVILHNAGKEEFIIKKGDRVAQLLFFPIFQAIFQKATEVSETHRGEGGFGSTGV